MIEFWLFIVLSLQFFASTTPVLLFLNPRPFGKQGMNYAHIWGMAVWSILSTYIRNFVLTANETTVMRTFLLYGLLFLFLCIFYEDSIRKKLMAIGLHFLNVNILEIFTMLLIVVAFPSLMPDFDLHTVEGIWVFAVMIPAYPLPALLEYRLVKGQLHIRTSKQMLLAWIFPLFALFQHPIQDAYYWSDRKVAFFQVPARLFLVSVGIYWMFWLVANTRAEEEERELREIHMTIAEHQILYRKLEERSEEIAKLRHDYRNQLSGIRGLIEEDPDEAERMVEELVKQLKTS